ncbi:MAG: hypothetical protein V1492_06020 [Candidatus Micrarchaeota archaeon]
MKKQLTIAAIVLIFSLLLFGCIGGKTAGGNGAAQAGPATKTPVVSESDLPSDQDLAYPALPDGGDIGTPEEY